MLVFDSAAQAAFISTALISLAPNLIFLFMPNYAAGSHSSVLQLGQFLAAGGLLGDVFLHTLSSTHDHANHSSSVYNNDKLVPEVVAGSTHSAPSGLWVLLGFTIFLAADMMIRAVEESNKGGHHSHCHSHAHINGSIETKEKDVGHATNNKSVVWLNIVADALHNFTDGLAIGASYALDSSTLGVVVAHKVEDSSTFALVTSTLLSFFSRRGGMATLSILLHEVPHELGDVCTLIRAGYSTKQAILMQFCTAIAALLGTSIALVYSTSSGNNELLLLITAGGFIYLAAVQILPSVLEEQATIKMRISQLVCFGMGVFLLYLVAVLEEHDHEAHQHNHQHHTRHSEL